MADFIGMLTGAQSHGCDQNRSLGVAAAYSICDKVWKQYHCHTWRVETREPDTYFIIYHSPITELLSPDVHSADPENPRHQASAP